MKSAFSISAVIASILFSCGPAAEDRNAMHARAKVFQDSIAFVIKSTMAEAEGPVNTAVKVDTSSIRHSTVSSHPAPGH